MGYERDIKQALKVCQKNHAFIYMAKARQSIQTKAQFFRVSGRAAPNKKD